MEKHTGLAWKHHIAYDFEHERIPTSPNGVGKGGTIFLDYDKMLEYLRKDGRKWYVAELELNNTPIIHQNDYMATILVNKTSRKGFFPLD